MKPLLPPVVAIAFIVLAGTSGCRSNEVERAPDPADTTSTQLDTTTPTSADTTAATPDTTPTEPTPLPQLPPAARVEHGRFTTSAVCASCHSNHPTSTAMQDAAGREVGPWDLWHATMMGMSSRDPLWRAVLSAEVATVPSQREAIEAKCTRCHAPMAAFYLEAEGAPPANLATLAAGDDAAGLGLDGVSCGFCHSIDNVGLGAPESFTGHPTLATGDVMFGPHAAPFVQPMQSFVGLTPMAAPHMRESALCATCHTLHTDALRADGAAAGGRLPEQTPYLEWRASAFSTEAPIGAQATSCQDCHALTADDDGVPISTRLARRPSGGDFPPIDPREPYGRHLFVGGNTLVLSILRDQSERLAPGVSAEAFDLVIAGVRHQLREHTAHLTVSQPRRDGGIVRAQVHITNLTGHKLPTGYPARRVWLRVRVLDAAGATLVASGEHDAAGRILDGTGAVAEFERVGGPVAPHRQEITSADEVVIYEPVMAQVDGTPTWRLMFGAAYHKDNRLLPEGWRSDHPNAAEVAPVGVNGDDDFVGGGDIVEVALPVLGDGVPVELEVTLLYQTLGARFAAELFTYDTPEVRAFRVFYDAAERSPETITTMRAPIL